MTTLQPPEPRDYKEIIFFGEKGAILFQFTKKEFNKLEDYYQEKYKKTMRYTYIVDTSSIPY